MVNLLGECPPLEELLEHRGAHVHVYGKRAAPGRKLGHVTVCAEDERELHARLRQLALSIPFLPPIE
jgi:5-(carboxyamino)imidazole ribonucleotide synthase